MSDQSLTAQIRLNPASGRYHLEGPGAEKIRGWLARHLKELRDNSRFAPGVTVKSNIDDGLRGVIVKAEYVDHYARIEVAPGEFVERDFSVLEVIDG